MGALKRLMSALHGDTIHPWKLTGFVLVSLFIVRFPLEAVSMFVSSYLIVGLIVLFKAIVREEPPGAAAPGSGEAPLPEESSKGVEP